MIAGAGASKIVQGNVQESDSAQSFSFGVARFVAGSVRIFKTHPDAVFAVGIG